MATSSAALQVRTQARFALVTNLRTPQSLFFGVAFPILLLVLFNSIFAKAGDSSIRFSGISVKPRAYNTAGMAAYAVMVQTFTGLLISLVTQRENGQLKRLRGTPVKAWTFVAAWALRCVVLVFVVVLALFLIGILAFDVDVRAAAIPGIVIYLLVGTASLASLGIAATALAKGPDVASTIGPFAAVLLAFVSGVFIPVSQLPEGLVDAGRVFPLAHVARGLQRCLANHGSGTGLNAVDLGILAAWAVLGALIAARTFRWTPQTTQS